jgi:hypothetical protein
VNRSKLHIVPEALDTEEWDPAKYQPLPDLSGLALQPVWGNNVKHAAKPFGEQRWLVLAADGVQSVGWLWCTRSLLSFCSNC